MTKEAFNFKDKNILDNNKMEMKDFIKGIN